MTTLWEPYDNILTYYNSLYQFIYVVYDAACQEGLDKLQRLQNKCLKICKGYGRRFDTDRLHTITKVPLLKKRRFAHINNFMHSKLNQVSWVDNRVIGTRAHDAPMFKVKIPRIETYKRAVGYAGAVQWNILPIKIRNIKTSAAFKVKQKAVMLGAV